MEFLNEYHLAGLFIGICTFLIIGLFHPVVVKAEYYWGTKCWWIFLILGIGGVIASLSIDNVIPVSYTHPDVYKRQLMPRFISSLAVIG